MPRMRRTFIETRNSSGRSSSHIWVYYRIPVTSADCSLQYLNCIFTLKVASRNSPISSSPRYYSDYSIQTSTIWPKGTEATRTHGLYSSITDHHHVKVLSKGFRISQFSISFQFVATRSKYRQWTALLSTFSNFTTVFYASHSLGGVDDTQYFEILCQILHSGLINTSHHSRVVL